MLRCILKQGSKYYSLYWIDKNKNGAVVGGMNNAKYISEIVGFDVKDYHFTYLPSGQLHYSYKNLATNQFLKASHDQLEFKDKGSFEGKAVYKGRNPINWLIPPSSSFLPLSDYENPLNSFYFPTHGFKIPIVSQMEELMNTTKKKKWNEKDYIIIDPDVLGNGLINIAPFISHQDYVHLDSPAENMQSWVIKKNFGLSKIGLWVRFDPE